MGQRRILVAHDEEGIGQLVKEALALDDFKMLTARDGHEAFRVIGEVALDAAILDIVMPR